MTQEPGKKSSTGLEENIAALLCYVLGWVSGIVFLVLEKENQNVKFHAWQSIITFGGLTVIIIALNILSVIPLIGWLFTILAPLVGLGGFVLWILLLIKALQGGKYKLPYVGDLAEKQIS